MISVQIEQAQNASIQLKSAILMYGDANKTVYASHHPVRRVNGKETIGAGTSLSASVLNQAVRDLSPVSVTDCFIDDNVIAFRDGLIGWWRKPQATRVWFHSKSLHEARQLPGKPKPFSVQVPLPGFIFFVFDEMFFVYSYKGDERPNRNTEIFAAPVMNVWDTGQICTGSVKLPKSSNSASIPAWEKAFFKSRFTHFNGKTSVDYDGGRIALTRDLVEGKFDVFPEAVLSGVKLKLGPLVAKFSKLCSTGNTEVVDHA